MVAVVGKDKLRGITTSVEERCALPSAAKSACSEWRRLESGRCGGRNSGPSVTTFGAQNNLLGSLHQPARPIAGNLKEIRMFKNRRSLCCGVPKFRPHPPQSSPPPPPRSMRIWGGGALCYSTAQGPQDRPWVRPTRNPSETESGARLPRGAGWCCGHRKTQPQS